MGDPRAEDLDRRIAAMQIALANKRPIPRKIGNPELDHFVPKTLPQPAELWDERWNELHSTQRRNIFEVLLPFLLAAAIVVLFQVQKPASFSIKVDPIWAFSVLAGAWYAGVRMMNKRPLIALRGEWLILYGPFRRKRVALSEIAHIALEREALPLPCAWVVRRELTHRLVISSKRLPREIVLSPSSATGGLFALRRFASAIALRLTDLGFRDTVESSNE